MRAILTGWLTDLRHAWRALRRTPGFTTMSVATLGLASRPIKLLDAVIGEQPA